MRKKRRKPVIMVPVASMGDIAFLLIIFFMVCSRFAQDAGVKLDSPQSLDVAKMQENPITVSIDIDGFIYFQGRKVPDAGAVEWGVRALVEGKDDDQAKTVMFRCDREIGKEVFEPVLEAIAAGGGRIAAVGEKASNK